MEEEVVRLSPSLLNHQGRLDKLLEYGFDNDYCSGESEIIADLREDLRIGTNVKITSGRNVDQIGIIQSRTAAEANVRLPDEVERFRITQLEPIIQ